jgi:hypothetical protein
VHGDIMLSIVLLSASMQSVIVLSASMQGVIMLCKTINSVMLTVVHSECCNSIYHDDCGSC